MLTSPRVTMKRSSARAPCRAIVAPAAYRRGTRCRTTAARSSSVSRARNGCSASSVSVTGVATPARSRRVVSQASTARSVELAPPSDAVREAPSGTAPRPARRTSTEASRSDDTSSTRRMWPPGSIRETRPRSRTSASSRPAVRTRRLSCSTASNPRSPWSSTTSAREPSSASASRSSSVRTRFDRAAVRSTAERMGEAWRSPGRTRCRPNRSDSSRQTAEPRTELPWASRRRRVARRRRAGRAARRGSRRRRRSWPAARPRSSSARRRRTSRSSPSR